ncbi:MAG: hypothetical protein JOZ37_03640 [Actinobacteria bacterium]|nr:hypothetical protein [Actinomycetota bacterium]MBV8960748.1 hypothetical protein [Actinomycetota bacterium]MBV9253678.1 hypothetical protein [Actinomycetota bacterium]MBV9663036.1 hypothetical protein [Actinomycetota bacterium]MBV9936813.1 hypothetical protein [Actinomycetota bacterium]
MGSKLRVVAVGFLAAFTSIGMGMFAPAANAAPGDTGATFTLTGGTLSITVPSSTANLGSVATGTATTGSTLGSTSVSDQRGALVASWTVSVTSTDFTTGAASANETVPKANVAYSSGLSTSSTGTGVFTPGVIPSLSASNVLPGAAWAGVSNNSAAWNPTVTVTLNNTNGTAAVAGTYSGTIHQSVA